MNTEKVYPTITTTTTKTEKQSPHPCGFCSTGHHTFCHGGVLNGNQTEVYLCGCQEHDLVVRCLNCGNKTPGEVSRETWTCIDVEACTATVARKRREAYEALFGGRTPAKLSKAREKAPKAPAKPKTGSCLCCDEPTKGGLFLPGHDSRYLSRTVDAIKTGVVTLDATLDAWAARGLSEALRAKLTKRVTA